MKKFNFSGFILLIVYCLSFPSNLISDFLALPIILYSPETRFAIGAGGIYYDYQDTNKSTLPNELSFYGLYTQNKQFKSKIENIQFFDNQNYRLIANFGYYDFPDRFWGIGNETASSNETEYNSIFVRSSISFAKNFNNRLFIGTYLRYFNFRKPKFVDNKGVFDGVVGINGSTTLQFGFNLIDDKRSDAFYPDTGYFNEINLGVSYDFVNDKYRMNLDFDLRKYSQTIFDWILAYQLYTNLGSGQLAFQMQPRLGSEFYFRGLYEGRIINNNLVSGQVELRIPLFWRFFGTTFVSIANTALTPLELIKNRPHYAVGFGGRFRFFENSKLTARGDIAYSIDGWQIYINIKEAF